MVQDFVEVNQVRLPIVKEGGEIYYPVSYLGSRVLLKDLKGNQLKRNGYGEYLKQFEIDFGEGIGGINLSYCISEVGLRKILSNSRIGGLSEDQKIAMNGLLKYLGMELISIDERFVNSISNEVIESYNEYIRDCINDILKDIPEVMWQKCSKCGNYYPYHLNFFRENVNCGKDYNLYTFCRDCCGWTENRSKDWIRQNNNLLSNIFRNYGIDYYKIYRDHNVLDIYNHWISLDRKNLPNFINNENDKMIIIKYLYENGKFDEHSIITAKIVHEVTKFRVDGNRFIQKITKELRGIISKNGTEYIEDIESARRIFFKYLQNNDIVTDEQILRLNYDIVFRKAHLHGYLERTSNNILTLIMDLFEDKYPAYKFKSNGFKYWDNKENRIKALKYLIEVDLKLQLEKVPLYITLTALRTHGTTTMYGICKKYYKCLWEWVNEVYPNKFEEQDFHIHVIRNNFDSMEEAEVHDILKSKFKNVIYNARNTENTIEFEGMIPDWFVFTNSKVWIIEYFGINAKHGEYNQRISDYKEKTLKKIEKYVKIDGYGKIYLYPEDLKNGFEGLHKKLEEINLIK
jgi:hypothetical protein